NARFLKVQASGGNSIHVTVSDAWTLDAAIALNDQMRRLAQMPAASVVLDGSRLTALDSAGAWVLGRTMRALADRGVAIQATDMRDDYRALLDKTEIDDPDIALSEPASPALVALLGRTGASVLSSLSIGAELLGFFGLTIVTLGRILVGRTRVRWISLLRQVEAVGFDALPIVGLLCFLVGVVLAYMGALQLQRFGASILTVNLVGVSVLREIGVLLTAIIVAGRSGSAFTAQIGTMKVNQEVDAMETLGLSPVDVLVIPRLIALFIALPLLVFFGDMMGLLGGAVISVVYLDLSFGQFLVQLKDAVDFWDFGTGLIKAPVFAYVIALVSCHQGLQVSGSAESVGIRTTASVVQSIFLVIVLDAIFAIFFAEIGI
ncbi:MAG: MlaE family lipid ABC transporter permease subunit, partial [Alphaproteobacteria bacterium]|nr:MlaE family lipid ABC transporter permease subunit [Alphaproteobacteria bacterium]